MLENVSDTEIRLQKENDELRAKIAHIIAIIDATMAFKFRDELEETIHDAVVRPVLTEVKVLLQCQ